MSNSIAGDTRNRIIATVEDLLVCYPVDPDEARQYGPSGLRERQIGRMEKDVCIRRGVLCRIDRNMGFFPLWLVQECMHRLDIPLDGQISSFGVLPLDDKLARIAVWLEDKFAPFLGEDFDSDTQLCTFLYDLNMPPVWANDLLHLCQGLQSESTQSVLIDTLHSLALQSNPATNHATTPSWQSPSTRLVPAEELAADAVDVQTAPQRPQITAENDWPQIVSRLVGQFGSQAKLAKAYSQKFGRSLSQGSVSYWQRGAGEPSQVFSANLLHMLEDFTPILPVQRAAFSEDRLTDPISAPTNRDTLESEVQRTALPVNPPRSVVEPGRVIYYPWIVKSISDQDSILARLLGNAVDTIVQRVEQDIDVLFTSEDEWEMLLAEAVISASGELQQLIPEWLDKAIAERLALAVEPEDDYRWPRTVSDRLISSSCPMDRTVGAVIEDLLPQLATNIRLLRDQISLQGLIAQSLRAYVHELTLEVSTHVKLHVRNCLALGSRPAQMIG